MKWNKLCSFFEQQKYIHATHMREEERESEKKNDKKKKKK